MARLAMLIDLTRCIGCDACTVACKQENGTPADVFFARVLNAEAGTYPDVKRVYVPVLCNHCDNPACLKACPNKAIFRRDDGIVLIDQDRCRGTGACVSACPYGNIVLKASDQWYLPEDRAYERDHVKPRLNQNVARKCTFCAQRVDRGLEPACVVACPTTARIFGDTEDPQSKVSRYVAEQDAQTGRAPFKLLPEASTQPANMYLATMAQQKSSGTVTDPIAGRAPAARTRSGAAAAVAVMAALVALLLVMASLRAGAQAPDAVDVWSSSVCSGCHGAGAMGGLGPPLAQTKLSSQQFLQLVRTGKGMMPAVKPAESSDAEVATIYGYVRTLRMDRTQIPRAYKVGALLTVPRVGLVFAIAGLISVILALNVLRYWLGCAGLRELRPLVRRFGYGRAAVVVARSLVVDGLFLSSVWKKDRFRWAMHGLMLYGFVGLILTDIALSIVNPERSQLSLMHPLKLIPNLAGLAIVAGIAYVRYRYSRDEFINNGVTIGRDYLFLNLVALTILTGFVVEIMRYTGMNLWVQPLYIVHLGIVLTLIVTAPFTRFSHVFVAPALIAMTKLTNAIADSGVEPGFRNEPCPGRHHKSVRIAADVLANIDPGVAGALRLRYYP